MPLADGLVRRYDALDLTDGFVGAVEYTYVADEDEILLYLQIARAFVNFLLPLRSIAQSKQRL